MYKNYPYFYSIFILCCLVAGCQSYSKQEHAKLNSLKFIDSLVFDNRVDINNIVDLGVIEAEATITEVVNKDETILTGENLKINVKKSTGEVTFDEGSVLQEGEFAPLTDIANAIAYIKDIKAAKKDKKTVNKYRAEVLAKNIANFNLLEAAKQKSATAIMIPQYSTDVKIVEQGKNGLFKIVEYTKTVYTVRVFARAVNFKAVDPNKKD